MTVLRKSLYFFIAFLLTGNGKSTEHQSWAGYDCVTITNLTASKKAEHYGLIMDDTRRQERLHYVARVQKNCPRMGTYSEMHVTLSRKDERSPRLKARAAYLKGRWEMIQGKAEDLFLDPPKLEVLRELIQRQAGLSDDQRKDLEKDAASFITTWEEAGRIANGMSSAPPAGDAPDCC